MYLCIISKRSSKDRVGSKRTICYKKALWDPAWHNDKCGKAYLLEKKVWVNIQEGVWIGAVLKVASTLPMLFILVFLCSCFPLEHKVSFVSDFLTVLDHSERHLSVIPDMGKPVGKGSKIFWQFPWVSNLTDLLLSIITFIFVDGEEDWQDSMLWMQWRIQLQTVHCHQWEAKTTFFISCGRKSLSF